MSSLPVQWLHRQRQLNAPLQEGPQRIGPGGIPDMTDMNGRLYGVPSFGRWSNRKKLRKLREMAEAYGNDPRMRFFTVNQVMRPAGATNFRDYARVARTLLAAVQDGGTLGIIYTNEPNEQLQSPWWTLKVRTGDCDDLAILLAAMAHSIRLPWRFVLAGTNRRGEHVRWAEGERAPRGGLTASHIYLDLGWPPFSEGKRHPNGAPVTSWAAAEPTLRGVPLGHDVVIHGVPGQGRRYDLGGPRAMGVVHVRQHRRWDPRVRRTVRVRRHTRSSPSLGGVIYSRKANWGGWSGATGVTGVSSAVDPIAQAQADAAQQEADYYQMQAYTGPGSGFLSALQDKPLVGTIARAVASLDASLIIAEAIGAVIQAVVVGYALSRLKLS